MSALDAGASDDLLAELDKLLASTPDLDALVDSFANLPLDATTYVANAFEPLDGPYPCENDAVVKVEKAEHPARLHPGTRATGDGGKDARLTPYTKAKPQRRKRAKDELDYLRRKVVDLEETLSSLNQVGSPKAFCASDEDKEVFFRWKQVAERQKEEVNKAVVENLKLRAMLEGQLTIAKRLEAVMGEYQQQVASDAFPWHPNQTRRGIELDDAKEATRPTPSDDVIFSDLNGSLEEQYRQVDSLLETSGIAHVKTETVGKHYLKQDVQGISFLVEEVRVFPFMFQAVAGATWSCMLSPSSELYGEFQTRILEKNHLNVTILDTVQLPKSQPTRVLHRLALRRHFEANRVVLLWSGWLQIDGSLFVRLRSKGASVISSFDFTNGKASSARPQGTIVRNIVDVKPELVELGSTDDRIGEMTDLVLGMYHRNMGMYNQVVENLLLKDLLGA